MPKELQLGKPLRKRILAVGAFERDNFGDHLFYHITREHLSHQDVVAASLVDSVVDGGEKVSAYPGLLRESDWDAVWVVGGEVGAVRIDSALRMTLQGAALGTYLSASEEERDAIAISLGHAGRAAAAYIPEVAAYVPDGRPLPALVLHSVGLSSLTGQIDIGVREQFARLVASATRVGVRESRSALYARTVRGGSQDSVDLAPDMVHGIVHSPYSSTVGNANVRDGLAIVQLNARAVYANGLQMTAAFVAQVAQVTGGPVTLLAAGTAAGHDSISLYLAIAHKARALAPTAHIDVLARASVADRTALIARARIWVGTSLHGRIVASAYQVPRVSLSNAKVSTYAEEWDPGFPHGVSTHSAGHAIDCALTLASDRVEQRRSQELSALAHESTLRAVESLDHV